jgi:hypothetical protein
MKKRERGGKKRKEEKGKGEGEGWRKTNNTPSLSYASFIVMRETISILSTGKINK